VPRLVNTLCDTAMMAAFAANRDCCTLGDVASSIDELQWPEFATRRRHKTASNARRAAAAAAAGRVGAAASAPHAR